MEFSVQLGPGRNQVAARLDRKSLISFTRMARHFFVRLYMLDGCIKVDTFKRRHRVQYIFEGRSVMQVLGCWRCILCTWVADQMNAIGGIGTREDLFQFDFAAVGWNDLLYMFLGIPS